MAKKKVTVPKYDRYLAEVREAQTSEPSRARPRWGDTYIRTLATFDPKAYADVQSRPEYEASLYDDMLPALLEWLQSRWKGQ